MQGHFEVAKILIEAGGDVDQERTNGESPLWMAAYNNHLDIVEVGFLCRSADTAAALD